MAVPLSLRVVPSQWRLQRTHQSKSVTMSLVLRVPPSIFSQCGHWIHGQRAPRGEQAGDRCHETEQRCTREIGRGIEQPDAEKSALQGARQHVRPSQSEQGAHHNNRGRVAENEFADAPCFSAERNAYSELPPASGYHKRDDAIETDGREGGGECGQQDEQVAQGLLLLVRARSEESSTGTSTGWSGRTAVSAVRMLSATRASKLPVRTTNLNSEDVKGGKA